MKKKVAACVALGLMLTGCTQTTPTATQTQTSTPVASQANTNAKKTDTAEITLKDGSKIKVTINKVTSTEERNDSDTTDPNQVIMLDFGYENVSSSEDIIVDSSKFRVYDGSNVLATSYNLTTGRNYGYIKKGTKLANADLFYALINESTFVTVDFRYNGGTAGDPDATFVIEIQQPE